jgi:hypothetical protein
VFAGDSDRKAALLVQGGWSFAWIVYCLLVLDQ